MKIRAWKTTPSHIEIVEENTDGEEERYIEVAPTQVSDLIKQLQASQAYVSDLEYKVFEVNHA